MRFLSISMLIIGLLSGGYWWVQQELSHLNRLTHHLSETSSELSALQEEIIQFNQRVKEYNDRWDTSMASLVMRFDPVQQDLDAIKRALQTQPSSPSADHHQAFSDTLHAFSEQLHRLREDLTQFQHNLRNDLSRTMDQIGKSQRDYHAIHIDLGTLPVGKNKPLVYNLPDTIPDTAREVLVYVYIETNYVKGGRHHFKIAVTLENAREAAFYLYATAHAQQSWSYNSENAWLPMPLDRQIKVSSEGETLFGSWISGIRIVAYR